MKRNLMILALLVLAPLSGCATGGIPSDIKIPADVSVMPPADTIPKNVAAFSGKWSGAWYGSATGTYMADQVVIVEKIVSPTSARVTYAGIGRWGQINGVPWIFRLDGTIANDTLEFSVPTDRGNVAVTLGMNRNGTLDATGVAPGGTWRGTFVRSPN
jgi:hypothetical protein